MNGGAVKTLQDVTEGEAKVLSILGTPAAEGIHVISSEDGTGSSNSYNNC